MPKRILWNHRRLPIRSVMLVVMVVFTAGLLFGGSTASAAQNDVSDTVKYCKSKMPKAVDDQCTTANMNQARAIFNDSCNKKAACIENGAESVVDEVAQKNPKSKKDFTDALTAAIKDKKPGAAGGGPSSGPSSGPTPTGQGQNCDDSSCDLISLYINPAISILSVIIGLVCAGSLIMAGIQYTSASGDPQKVGAAKTRITNTLLAFFAYLFLYAFMNFLIPGGLFG